MDPSTQSLAPESSQSLAGDLAPFSRALGAAEALASLSALAELLQSPRPESVPAIRTFLGRYREVLLERVELPAIRAAFEHAARGEVTELLALDRRLAGRFGTADSAFAAASRHAGRTQLRRLRPLRDRTLQRYLRAVDEGEATGWHVIVYGLLLALFSLPLRQGLVHYATQTQHSLLDSATCGLAVSLAERSRLREECDAPVGPAVHQALPAFEPRVV